MGAIVCSIVYPLWRFPYHIKEGRRRARAEMYRDAYAIIAGEFDFSQYNYRQYNYRQYNYRPTPREEAFWADVEAVMTGEMFERYHTV